MARLISGLSGEPGEWSCLLVIDKATWSSCNRFLERAHYGFQRLIGLHAAVHVGGRELRQRIGSVTALGHGGHDAGGAQHRIPRRRSRCDAPHSLLIVFPHLGEVGPGAHSIDLRHAREMRPRDFVGLQRERELAGAYQRIGQVMNVVRHGLRAATFLGATMSRGSVCSLRAATGSGWRPKRPLGLVVRRAAAVVISLFFDENEGSLLQSSRFGSTTSVCARTRMGLSWAAPWYRTTTLALLGIAPPTNKSESGNPTARRRLVMPPRQVWWRRWKSPI